MVIVMSYIKRSLLDPKISSWSRLTASWAQVFIAFIHTFCTCMCTCVNKIPFV